MAGKPSTRVVWARRLAALAAIVAVAVAVWLIVRGQADGVSSGTADGAGAEVKTIDVRGDGVEGSHPASLVIPEGGGGGRALLVFLHERGGDEESSLVDPMFQALDDLGKKAPVVVFPSSSEASYWHDRAEGDWGTFVLEDVIPDAAKASGADPDRVAIGGISMGGFGALDLARIYPERFCAIGAHSPALWASEGETAPGAFDDPDDFARNDVVNDPDAYADQHLWIDEGDEDPFVSGDEAFVSGLEAAGVDVTAKQWPGGHNRDYWDSHWGDYLGFYARELADC